MVSPESSQSIQNSSHTMELYHEAYQYITNFLSQRSKQKPDFSKTGIIGNFISFTRAILCKIGMKVLVDGLWNTFVYRYYRSNSQNNTIRTIIGTVFYALTEPQKLDMVYQMLADDESKAVLNWFLKYRFAYLAVGPVAAEVFPHLDYVRCPNRNVKRKMLSHTYRFQGYTIKCWNDWYFFEETWINEQYLLSGICEPKAGEFVIDAGGFQGETAIWLADKVGQGGKVFSFEPLAVNYRRMQKNIRRNLLENTIQAVNQGLWDEDTQLFITDNSSASTCYRSCSGAGAVEHGCRKVQVTTLDSFIHNEGLQRVDFIKMDIEGAEYRALQGAAKTIMRWKPKLAVSVYHLPEDIFEIPVFIKSLVPEYKIYLSHKNKGWHETVLFAVAEG